MAEERDQMTTPPVSPLSPDLPVVTPVTGSELDDVERARLAGATGIGTPGTGTPSIGAAGTGAPGSATTTTDDPEEIRQQIERTREGMSDTLNELQQRLTPQNLAQQAKDSVREAAVGRVQHLVGSAGETASDVAVRAQHAAGVAAEQVREHPVPVVLAGAGAGLVWWLMRRSSSRQTWSNDDMYDWDDADATYDRDYATLELRSDDDWRTQRSSWSSGGGGLMRVFRDHPVPTSIAAASIGYMLWSRRSGSDYDTVGMRSSYAYGDESMHESSGARLTDAAREKARQAREKARHASERAREKAGAIGEQVGERVRSAQERASAVTHDVSNRVRSARYRTTSQFDRWMHENPMAVGVAALAAGAVVGLSVPRTRTEDQVMGSSRDALIDKASDQAQQLKEQVREKVQEVAGDLTGSADEGSGSTPGSTSTGSTAFGSSGV